MEKGKRSDEILNKTKRVKMSFRNTENKANVEGKQKESSIQSVAQRRQSFRKKKKKNRKQQRINLAQATNTHRKQCSRIRD